METIYAFTHFCSIVLIYRIVLIARVGPMNASVIFPTLISALVWLSGVGIFLFFTYPNSLDDIKWVEVRGIVHGLMLTVVLEGGMLM
jgi:hypothetical protein